MDASRSGIAPVCTSSAAVRVAGASQDLDGVLDVIAGRPLDGTGSVGALPRVRRTAAGVFLLLAVSLGALLATIPVTTYMPVWAVTMAARIAGGIAASVLWLRSVLRSLGIAFRFAPVTAL